MPSKPILAGQMLGFIPHAVGSVTNLALSASTTWLGLGFVSDRRTSVSEVSIYVSAATGSPGSADVTCEIYSDNAGKPNASLVASTAMSPTTAVANSWIRFAFGTPVPVTEGTQYWPVIKCPNAPTKQVTPVYVTNAGPLWRLGGNVSTYGWIKNHDTAGSLTWPNGTAIVGGLRVGYSDGSYAGLPIQGVATGADKAFGTSEVGVRLTTPGGASLVARGLAFLMATPAGTPTGNLVFKLYSGASATAGSPIATCAAIPNANAKVSGWLSSYFVDGSGNPASVTIAPGTVLRATLADSAADSSTSYFRATDYTWDSDAASLPLLPLEGTASKTVLTAGTFDDSATNHLIPFALLLDSGGEFAAAGGGGGGIVWG